MSRQLSGTLGGGNDDFERLAMFGGKLRLALQDVCVPEYSRQQVVEIVRDASCEHAEAFHFLRHARAFLERSRFTAIARDDDVTLLTNVHLNGVPRFGKQRTFEPVAFRRLEEVVNSQPNQLRLGISEDLLGSFI